MNINIQPDGSLSFIWNDALQPLLELGTPTVRRASHVEPTEDGKWTADLTPSGVPGAPVLGPFDLRQDALAAEVAWLQEHGF